MSDIVERLRAEIASLEAQLERMNAAHLRERERLRAALKPFAQLEMPDYVPDDAMVIVTDVGGGIIPSNTPNYVRAGDVREARRALEEK